MKHRLQRHALLLAALLQVLPIVRNFVTNPAFANSFAIILKWGIGSAVAVGAYDAASAATNYFTSASNFVGTVNIAFTNNLTILPTPGDGQALCTITTNGVVAAVLANGQTTTNGMPKGLIFKFFDPNNGVSGSLYCSIGGTPTVIGTNLFHVNLSRSGSTTIPGDFSIKILGSASTAPVITNQPIAGITNLVGSSSSAIAVVAGGTAPLGYQWFLNTNTAVTGATSPTLALANIQLSQAGYYRCTITNSAGTTNTANTLLTVWQPPVITNNPIGATNVAGGNATFTVTAGGVPAPAYQWVYNGLTPQAGATANSLSLSGLRASQAGAYTVVITNSAGSITSAPALLGITNPPPPLVAQTTLSAGNFQFTFNTIPGLTNTVQTNGNLTGGTWGDYTNIPPTGASTPVTLTNFPGQPNLYYRLMVQP